MTLSNRAVTHLQGLVGDAIASQERYALDAIVGRGGMGVVYRALDTVLQREVAVKLLDNDRALSLEATTRLRREAGILAHLEHPGIVPVHDIGLFDDGRVFYVMRLVRGQRLDEHIAAGATRGDVLRIMLRLCETVAFANAQGVVHRDLKPGNVMIGPFGEVLVLDWGVAKILSEREGHEGKNVLQHSSELPLATSDGAIIGTPGYMSPEQRSGSSATVNQTADVYALGVMLKEVLAHSQESRDRGGNPRALNAIVTRATNVEPGSRYSSAGQLADDIRRWMDGQPVVAYREQISERAFRLFRQNQTAILLVATYLAVRTVILLWRHI
jgi:eukaryotic-like serine/threonine-protein kinase